MKRRHGETRTTAVGRRPGAGWGVGAGGSDPSILGCLLHCLDVTSRGSVERGHPSKSVFVDHTCVHVGYFAWSIVAFTLTEEPLSEFLALYAALYIIIVKRSVEAVDPIPTWSFHAETERV